MTTNINRPTITYENVCLLKGGAGSFLSGSNDASSIKLVPLVQDFSFDFNTKTEDILTLGDKFYSKSVNRYDVDVNLDVNIFETFEDMFSGFFSGNAVLEDLDQDASFYFLIGKKKYYSDFSDADETINFGNAFLENFTLTQSINQFLTSKYTYSCSNINAQTIVSNEINNPAVNLTGDQSQIITTTLPNVQGLLDAQTNLQDDIFPAYKTNLSISGVNSENIFLIKADMIQDFSLSMPFGRKKIFSIGKKYPIKRKFVHTTEGSLSASFTSSEFNLSGPQSNLKDFLETNDSYVVNLSFENGNSDTQEFQISGARLSSNSQSISLGQNLNSSFSFNFNIFDFGRV